MRPVRQDEAFFFYAVCFYRYFHGPGTERGKMSGYEYSPETFKAVSELFV